MAVRSTSRPLFVLAGNRWYVVADEDYVICEQEAPAKAKTGADEADGDAAADAGQTPRPVPRPARSRHGTVAPRGAAAHRAARAALLDDAL